MSLHRLLSLGVGVPRPAELAGFYREAKLACDDAGTVTCPDGGQQIHISEAPYRQLRTVHVGASRESDLAAVAEQMASLGLATRASADGLTVTDPSTQVAFTVTVCEPLAQTGTDPVADNRPGAIVRHNRRAPSVFEAPRPPRRLGHMVIGTPDVAATRRFLVEGLGFKVSDEIEGIISFLRCSTDHHNIGLVHSSVPLLQHYSMECDDVDHVGHAATALLRADQERQVWGFGRHFVGSNFYWYLRDPSGSFMELYSDMDVIDDDDEWDAVGRTAVGFEHVANSWGPDIPMEFIVPNDLAELEAGWAGRS